MPLAYKIGAYAAYPLLAAAGGALLSRANSKGAIAAAAVPLAGALVLSAVLGRYCRRCGESFLPRLLRLLILPVSIMTALAVRTPQMREQYFAFGLICLSGIVFSAAWQLSAPAVPETKKEGASETAGSRTGIAEKVRARSKPDG
jgi:hypothetical protein